MPQHPLCRANHIGSLLRPKPLRDAHKALGAGGLDAAGFEHALQAAISTAILRQEEAGLSVVTDGEFRRRSWFAGFVDAVDGLEHRDTHFNFVEGEAASISVPVPHNEGRVRRVRSITGPEFACAHAVATRPVKITMPAPSVMHFFRGPDAIDRRVYEDDGQYWDDLVAVYAAEIAELGRLGCRYLQLDEVPIALLCDRNVQERVAHWGWDWRQLLGRYIDALNRAIRGRSADMAVGIHLCRGNFRGHWIGSGGYEPVAERLFAEVEADHFLLEYDSERAGDFRPLRFLPKEKSAVLGLVSSKTPALEAAAQLKRRIDEAATFADHARLALSPQCGFGTTVGGAPMSEEQQWRKLALVGQVAREMWS
ncbi:MAG: 5-methyltetrahydropteroyltriglutamate--homocysteine S-methyltransferase [Alphaproteobacteria bacterium]